MGEGNKATLEVLDPKQLRSLETDAWSKVQLKEKAQGAIPKRDKNHWHKVGEKTRGHGPFNYKRNTLVSIDGRRATKQRLEFPSTSPIFLYRGVSLRVEIFPAHIEFSRGTSERFSPITARIPAALGANYHR